MTLNLRQLPFLLLTKRLLLQRARSNMVPFNFALEANNLGRIFDLFLALLLVVLDPILTIGLLLDVGDKSKSSLVIGGFLHTQDIVECGLPFMTVFQVLLQKETWALCSLVFPTWLVTTQLLEEVEASLLEQQGKTSNPTQGVSIV